MDTLNKPPEYLRDTLASFMEQDVATVQLLANLIGDTAITLSACLYHRRWSMFRRETGYVHSVWLKDTS